jgi:hypothetical protein
MPLLVYSYPDFTPNTIIQSSKVNAKYNDIKTLLNTTKLDDSNVQDAGLTRSTKLKPGTASYVVVNDGTGKMSEEAALSPLRGGLGIVITLATTLAGQVPQVSSDGTTFVMGPAPESAGSRIYNSFRFT